MIFISVIIVRNNKYIIKITTYVQRKIYNGLLTSLMQILP